MKNPVNIWDKIKSEYIQGIPPRELEAKYKIEYNITNVQIRNKAARENWGKQKKSTKNKIEKKIEQAIEEKINYTLEKSFENLKKIQSLALCPDGETGRLNLTAALKAEELIGRLLGLYIEKTDNKHELTDKLVKIEVITE